MTSSGFETAIPGSEILQTYAVDRAATGTGVNLTLRDFGCGHLSVPPVTGSALSLRFTVDIVYSGPSSYERLDMGYDQNFSFDLRPKF
jgi:hypothetical protein